MTRFALVPALALALALAPGCAGDDPAEVHSYVDSAGRSCTVDVHDISGTATCDASASAAVTCAPGTEPVFVTNDDVDFETHIWTLESCAGCIDRPNHTTNISAPTCANITCETDADCLGGNYRCMGGSCHHM